MATAAIRRFNVPGWATDALDPRDTSLAGLGADNATRAWAAFWLETFGAEPTSVWKATAEIPEEERDRAKCWCATVLLSRASLQLHETVLRDPDRESSTREAVLRHVGEVIGALVDFNAYTWRERWGTNMQDLLRSLVEVSKTRHEADVAPPEAPLTPEKVVQTLQVWQRAVPSPGLRRG